MKLLMILFIMITSCNKDISEPLPQPKPVVKAVVPTTPGTNLNTMLSFLHANAAKVYHEVQPLGGWWWHADSIFFNGKPIKSNTVFNPSFGEWSTNCLVARMIDFQQYEDCPGFIKYVPFTSTVIIHAGNKKFLWVNAPMQWKESKSMIAYCPSEKWGDIAEPKYISVYLRPLSK